MLLRYFHLLRRRLLQCRRCRGPFPKFPCSNAASYRSVPCRPTACGRLLFLGLQSAGYRSTMCFPCRRPYSTALRRRLKHCRRPLHASRYSQCGSSSLLCGVPCGCFLFPPRLSCRLWHCGGPRPYWQAVASCLEGVRQQCAARVLLLSSISSRCPHSPRVPCQSCLPLWSNTFCTK